MQYIAIKEENKNGTKCYVINAIPLKNKSVVQKIPHPLGTDVLVYKNLEEAKNAIIRSGFSYILPDGQKGSKIIPPKTILENKTDYTTIILEALKGKIDSSNSSISAAAILTLGEFPTEETFEILFNKIGEDNDLIRKNAISVICRYGNMLQDKIIEALHSQNWVTRNSAITCILKLAETEVDTESFIIPLSKMTNDTNAIVQVNALTTLAKVYQNYKKTKMTNN